MIINLHGSSFVKRFIFLIGVDLTESLDVHVDEMQCSPSSQSVGGVYPFLLISLSKKKKCGVAAAG